MLQGLKFIPRDQIDDARDDAGNDSRKGKRKSKRREKKAGRRNKHSRYDSSDDEGLARIESKSRKKAKWYASEEEHSSISDSSSESDSDCRGKSRKRGRKKRVKSSHKNTDDESPSDSSKGNPIREGRGEQNADGKRNRGNDDSRADYTDAEVSKAETSSSILRKEMGLDWMLRSKGTAENFPVHSSHSEPIKDSHEEIVKDNPRELNPYFKNNGSGYPEDVDHMGDGNKGLLSRAFVGDGGASWRLKAFKRAQEQAAREGKKLQNVVEERWGSMGNFEASVASQRAAPAYAHLNAVKDRRKGLFDDGKGGNDEENSSIEKVNRQKGIKDNHERHQNMRIPKVHQSLSWGKSKKLNFSAPDLDVVAADRSSLNKFSDDGSFMDKFMPTEGTSHDPRSTPMSSARSNPKDSASRENPDAAGKSEFSGNANQLAAKALQLRLKGKHEEAEKLMREVENLKARSDINNEPRRRVDATTSSLIMHDASARQKNREDDTDLHLAKKIMHNNRYNSSNQADEEYDYDGSPRKKDRKKKGSSGQRSHEITKSANRFLTQQERCAFCFDNPARPKHLVIAIGNFAYLCLPHQQPVAPGHCCILTLQHEHSTRSLDDNVWEEVRNFKKCLIMMFAKQEKEVLFMETVLHLARQKRHCLVECIPLPQDAARQAPLYFKKAIDEAEEEWSQHNAKKLIDTSEKGLRGSIPKNFPYFHVEFGLKKGFVHVVDDEKEFKSSFGLNVVRGMLQLPAEDMHRRRRHEPVEAQKEAVASFAREWEPFDWTKQL